MILLWTSAMNQSIVMLFLVTVSPEDLLESASAALAALSSYEEESLDSLVRESLSFRDQWL
jgi:hypothetical protein